MPLTELPSGNKYKYSLEEENITQSLKFSLSNTLPKISEYLLPSPSLHHSLWGSQLPWQRALKQPSGESMCLRTEALAFYQ